MGGDLSDNDEEDGSSDDDWGNDCVCTTKSFYKICVKINTRRILQDFSL